MKNILFALFCSAIIFGGCNTYSQKHYKKYQADTYDRYAKEAREEAATEQQAQLEKLQPQPVVSEPAQAEVSSTAADGTMEDLSADQGDNEVIESTNSTYGEAVVAMASKKIQLGENATYTDMQAFQNALDAAYNTARRTYHAAGFTYTLSPAGAVNPLSEMEVQCLLSDTSANAKGKAVCDLFFKQIVTEYAKGTNGAAL